MEGIAVPRNVVVIMGSPHKGKTLEAVNQFGGLKNKPSSKP